MHRRELMGLTREELIARAERLGVSRPRVLTQAELIDEILSRTSKTERERAQQRGWLGRARDLLASVVQRGLNVPESGRARRGEGQRKPPSAPPAPMPTVTLAEIYAAQGHFERAVTVLDEVLAREPEHAEARALRDRFRVQAQRAAAPVQRAAAIEESADLGDESAVDAEETRADETFAAASRAHAAESALEESSVRPEAGEAHSAVDRAASAALSGTSTPAALADASPPERYDVDEVVAVAVDPRTIYLYWEVRPLTLARARGRRAGGQLALRVVTVAPSWEGPVVETRDVVVDELFGDHFVRDAKPGANVRASIGWLAGGDFDPFAVGIELTMPRAEEAAPAAVQMARWAPHAADVTFTRNAGQGFAPAFGAPFGPESAYFSPGARPGADPGRRQDIGALPGAFHFAPVGDARPATWTDRGAPRAAEPSQGPGGTSRTERWGGSSEGGPWRLENHGPSGSVWGGASDLVQRPVMTTFAAR